MTDAYICDAVRTPIGRYGGSLSSIRADDLGALPLKALQERNQGVDWSKLDDVMFGCANQAGEDNRQSLIPIRRCRRRGKCRPRGTQTH